MLAVEETGDLKGDQAVGVQRQDTGTAGRIHNSPVVVFFGYASPHGQTRIDRRLYCPLVPTLGESPLNL